jgi:hypothetical protein
MRYTNDSPLADVNGWVEDAEGDLSRWEYLTQTFDHDPSFQNPHCLTPEPDVSTTWTSTDNYSAISFPILTSTASMPPFQPVEVGHGSIAGDIPKSCWELSPHESNQNNGLMIAPTQLLSIDASHGLMHSLQQPSIDQSSTFGMVDMCGMSRVVQPIDSLDCPDNAVDLEPIPFLPNLDQVLFSFPQLIGCDTKWNGMGCLSDRPLKEVWRDGRYPLCSTWLDHKVADKYIVDTKNKMQSYGEFTAKEPHIKNTTLSVSALKTKLVEPPAKQVPKMCLPLTAYNYFYRNERDCIVNAMQRPGDPIAPPIHDFSQSKMEELLHQHW